ncbi:MAG: hypothetical protein OXF02_07050, partial [Simkaniaceae bacterium]|nr:hypothetical protein [Simkaniaceae bacterium]
CNMALATASSVLRAAERYCHIGFSVPEKEIFATIENFSLPSTVKREDQVYTFLHFLYRPENMSEVIRAGFTLPVTVDTDPVAIGMPPAYITLFRKLSSRRSAIRLLKRLASERELRTMWIDAKPEGGFVNR